jgi:hypothetical protein
MSELNTVLKSQSFPPIDVRVAWAITIVCLLIGLLLTFGVLQVQVNPLPGWAWFAIVVAQALTALAVAWAARLSARRPGAEQPPAPMPEGAASTSPQA